MFNQGVSSMSDYGVDWITLGSGSPSIAIGTSVLVFLMRLTIISAVKNKIEINVPTNHNPRGKRKCSILRRSGLSGSGSGSKGTSAAVNPA